MKRKRTARKIAFLGILAAGAWASAQTAPADSRQNRPAGTAGGAAPAPTLGALLSGNGNSLSRAAAALPPGTQGTPLESVSYYAVAPAKPKTLHKHDLITIIVREDSNFSSNGTTDLQKSADFDAQLQSYIQLKLLHLQLNGVTPAVVPEIKASMQRDLKGQATVDRTDTLSARITAEVIDVKPNGNLVLQASKRIKTDDEEQELVLVGTCRAEDLNADNTILSNQLSDLSVTKNHKGAVRDTTKRGFIPGLLDLINPF